MNQDNNNSNIINNNINYNENYKNRSNKSKYGHLKHSHVPRVLQNNMPSFFDVYPMEGDAVYTIAANDIIHLPNDYQQRFSKGHNQHNNHRLIFCPHFHKHLPHNTAESSSNDSDETSSSCPFGEECSHVHAYLGNAKINSDIHINFAYKNLQEVKYDRYDFHSTAPLRVAPPNATSPFEDMPAHLCIRTNAYIGRDRITSHCAHYYFNRICNRGSRCFFVHAVSLESCACSSVNKHANISNSNAMDASGENNNNNNNEENKPVNSALAAAQDQYYVDPFYRRIYGRTEPLRHNNPTSNSKSSPSTKKNQKIQRPRCQNVVENKLSHVVTTDTNKNSSSSSSDSSPSTPMSDDAEMTNYYYNYRNNNNNSQGTDDDQHHHHHHESTTTAATNSTTAFPQPTTTVLSSSMSNSPRTMCPGCKKFVHNPYSWTETTVCLVRTSPVSPTPSN